jgi:hypothetical protein
MENNLRWLPNLFGFEEILKELQMLGTRRGTGVRMVSFGIKDLCTKLICHCTANFKIFIFCN